MNDFKVWFWRVRFAFYVGRRIHCGWLCAWRFSWDTAVNSEVDLTEHPRDAAIDEIGAWDG